MHVQLLKSKIHLATVTDGCVHYEGSLTIAVDLMERIGLVPFEKILCGNTSTGHRFETYVIPGERGSGAIILNGATARLGTVGDQLTIMAFGSFTPEEAIQWTPKVIVLGQNNVIVRERSSTVASQ